MKLQACKHSILIIWRKKMKKYIIKYLPENILVWFLGFINTALHIGMAYLGMYALNALIELNLDLFLKYVGIMLAGWCLTYFTNYVFEMFRAKTVQKILTGIRTDIAEKIMCCSYAGYHKENSAVYLSWLENDMKTIEVNGLVSIFYLVLHFSTLLTAFAALFFIHWMLALFALFSGLLLLFIPKIFEKSIEKGTMDLSMEMQNFISKIKDVLSGFDVLFCFNKRKIIKDTVHDLSVKRGGKVISLTGKYLISGIVIALFGSVFETLILGFTGFLAIRQVIALGAIMATGKIASQLSKALSDLTGLIVKIKSVKIIFNKFESLSIESSKELKAPSFKKEIELKDLSFAYNEQKNILSNLNMHFELGKKYGIIGESGSGKTTMFKLLAGMFENFKGSIAYDGEDISLLNKELLRENVAYIDQNVYIFNDTVKENICLGGKFTEEEINAALKNSALEDVIASCGNGLDTLAEENGKNFSGGQRQRIAIARALIHGRKILLIDEGTSSLDKENALEIEKRLIENPDLTVIMISHNFDPQIKEKLDGVYKL